MEHKYVRINEVNIHYVEAGALTNEDNKPTTIIFLHGFPEYWATWQAQLDYFSQNHRVIAPDLPGYNLSDKPEDSRFYQVSHLIEFFAAFIKNIAPNEEVYLVAHDWGGAIAWPLAAFFPELINKLVILNAAHPSVFTREMINNPLQRQKSEYIHELIADTAVEKLSENHCAYLSEKIFSGMNVDTVSDEKFDAYQQVWQQPGAINGMLQYYRAMPQLAPSDHHIENGGPITDTAEMKIPNIRINLPTLILWGEQDQAFVKENLNNIEEYVPNCKIERFPQASHWLQHEKSAEINQAIENFIQP